MVRKNNLFYEKSSDLPFSGQVKGLQNGRLVNGRINGLWITYLDNGNLTPNFIGSWIIEPSLCDDIIAYYEENKQNKIQGSASVDIKLEAKNRQDITLSPNSFVIK